MSATSETLSAMALVVSVLTFCITSWLNYYTNEWKKLMEEVTLSGTYDEAQEAATELNRLMKTLNNLRVSKERCEEQYRGHFLSPTLDYADIFFLHGRGLLRGDDIEPHCREIEAHRHQAQKAWDVIIGKYDSYQVLHHPNEFVQWLRRLVGLPNQPFFSKNWVGRGKRHMELVEPVDVANWYIVDTENRDYCASEEEIRPRRYVVLPLEIERVFKKKSWVDKHEAAVKERVNRYRDVVEQQRIIDAHGGQPESAEGAHEAGGGDTQKSDAAEPV